MNYFASMEKESLPSFDEQRKNTEKAVTLPVIRHSGDQNLANQSRLGSPTAEYIPGHNGPKRGNKHRLPGSSLSGENQNSTTYQIGQAEHNRLRVSACFQLYFLSSPDSILLTCEANYFSLVQID